MKEDLPTLAGRTIATVALALALVGSAASVLARSEQSPASPNSLGPQWTPAEGASLIGTPAPDWRGIEWIQGGPLALSDLRGKVVLLRFWLVGCPYCTRSAPALRELSQRYKDRGLLVVGLHHPKAEELRDPDTVIRAARALDFKFPIGLDNEWKTIRAYGVGRVFQRFTSVSFLIDRGGIIQFVHDGGEIHAGGGAEHRDCNAAYDALVKTIEESLSQKRDSARSSRRPVGGKVPATKPPNLGNFPRLGKSTPQEETDWIL